MNKISSNSILSKHFHTFHSSTKVAGNWIRFNELTFYKLVKDLYPISVPICTICTFALTHEHSQNETNLSRVSRCVAVWCFAFAQNEKKNKESTTEKRQQTLHTITLCLSEQPNGVFGAFGGWGSLPSVSTCTNLYLSRTFRMPKQSASPYDCIVFSSSYAMCACLVGGLSAQPPPY